MSNNELITKEQASESDMRAISQMFARAANAVVDASELGKEVKTLKTEVEKLVGDTQRLREHITWLEQENVTLRVSRDDAQNALSDAMRNIDHTKHENQLLDAKVSVTESERDNARGEAKLWQEEAASLEKERNGLKAEVTYLKGMLTSVWHGIKDHFAEAPKAEPEPVYANNFEEITAKREQRETVSGQGGTGPYHESPVAGATFNPHKTEHDIQF